LVSWRIGSVEHQLERAQFASSQWQQRQQIEHRRAEALEAELRSSMGSVPLVYRFEINRSAGQHNQRILKLPQANRLIVMLIEITRSREFHTFRVNIKDERGASKWQSPALKQESEGELAISFSSSVLVPGSYVLELESDLAGRYERLLGLPFLVIQ